jgi:hypothetical protein
MTYSVEDTAFVIDKAADHEECPECKGGTLPPLQMTTTYAHALTSPGAVLQVSHEQPIPDQFAHLPHGYSCSNTDCYFGKILTPYEEKMQKIIYSLSNKVKFAEVERAAPLSSRLMAAFKG